MSKTNLRGITATIALITAMIMGILFAGPAKADTQQDYMFYNLLQEDGWTITSPATAKRNALLICQKLLGGTNWRLVMTDVMSQADLDLDAAASLMAISIVVYCPSMDPRKTEGGQAA